MDYFNDGGSIMYAAEIDVSMAYDCVEHFVYFYMCWLTGMASCCSSDCYVNVREPGSILIVG